MGELCYIGAKAFKISSAFSRFLPQLYVGHSPGGEPLTAPFSTPPSASGIAAASTAVPPFRFAAVGMRLFQPLIAYTAGCIHPGPCRTPWCSPAVCRRAETAYWWTGPV